MSIKNEILASLYAGEQSGEELAKKLGVSRTAIWKAVKSLQEQGYRIDGVQNKGYRLLSGNMMSSEGVRHYLNSEWNLQVYDKVTSTNDNAKAIASGGADRVVVVSESQENGRGRMSRAFYSPDKVGLYFSAILRHEFDTKEIGLITAYSAVAVARAIEELSGNEVKIKWVNDIFMNGKKVCGILTEGGISMEGGHLEYAVVGIGINVKAQVLPDELESIATSIENESKQKIDREQLLARILDNLDTMIDELRTKQFVSEYRRRSLIIGKTVLVNGAEQVEVVGIDSDCALIVNSAGEQRRITTGEVSIKLL